MEQQSAGSVLDKSDRISINTAMYKEFDIKTTTGKEETP